MRRRWPSGPSAAHPYDGNGVVIDVSRLTFMDSTGIRVLQTLTKGPGATRVVLRSPRRGVQKVLELVGIAKRPPIAGGEGEQASREDFFIF